MLRKLLNLFCLVYLPDVLEITGIWGGGGEVGPSVQAFLGYRANTGAEPMYTKMFIVPPPPLGPMPDGATCKGHSLDHFYFLNLCSRCRVERHSIFTFC